VRVGGPVGVGEGVDVLVGVGLLVIVGVKVGSLVRVGVGVKVIVGEGRIGVGVRVGMTVLVMVGVAVGGGASKSGYEAIRAALYWIKVENKPTGYLLSRVTNTWNPFEILASNQPG
jgi:hypothetical protein